MDKAQTSTATPQWKLGILSSTILGGAAELIGEIWEGSISVGLTAFMFFLAALVVGRIFVVPIVINILSIGLGIAVGTFLGAIVDPTHNLWPIAIVIYWVIGAIPVTLGALLGAFWRLQSAKRSAR